MEYSFYDRIKDSVKTIPIISNILRYLKFQCTKKKYARKYDIYSIEEYIKLFDPKTTLIDKSKNTKVSSLSYYPEYKQEEIEVNLPPTLLIELKKCFVIGTSYLVIDSNDKALYNGNIGLNENNFDPALQTGLKSYITVGKSTYILTKNSKEHSIESGISLINSIPKNYFHFTHEVLIKFWVLSKANIPSDVPLIVNSESFEVPQFVELLKYFNILNRPIIKIEKLERLSVKKLYIITPVKISSGAPRNWKTVPNTYPRYNFDALDFLKDRIIRQVLKDNTSYPERIFISRKNYSSRSYNEVELKEVLIKNGFKIIYPETLSIWEQIALFSKAKIIVAASGAALTNLLYCSPGTNIIVFLNKILSFPVYSSISYHYGSNMIYIAADRVDNEKEYHTSMHINPEDLKAVLKDLGI